MSRCSLASPQAVEYIQALPKKPKVPFASLYPNANPLAIDLLEKMLVFDPRKRISAAAALEHECASARALEHAPHACRPTRASPHVCGTCMAWAHRYLRALHNVNDEPSAGMFDFTFEEQGVTETDLRKLIWQQLQKFHPELGQMPS